MNWYLQVLIQYIDFSGRARRKEFWMFFLFQMIIVFVFVFLNSLLGSTPGEQNDIVGFFYIVFLVLTLIPSIAVTVRRLHDIGKSGFWYFIGAIPLIGWLWLLILLCMEGEPKTNKWGKNPKGIGNEDQIDFIGKE